MCFEESLDVIMSHSCAHGIVLHKETFSPSCTVLKINCPLSDARNLQQPWLLSPTEPEFLLVSHRSGHGIYRTLPPPHCSHMLGEKGA